MSERAQGVAGRVIDSYNDPRTPHNLMLQLQQRGAKRMYRELSYEARAILAEYQTGREIPLGEHEISEVSYHLVQVFTRLGLDLEGEDRP